MDRKENKREDKTTDEQLNSQALGIVVCINNKSISECNSESREYNARLIRVAKKLLAFKKVKSVTNFLLNPNSHFNEVPLLDLVRSEWATNKHLLPFIEKLRDETFS